MTSLKQTLFIILTGSACLAGCITMQRTDLYFGRNIPGSGHVTDRQWASFSDSIISPAFPDGYTETDARGKWQDTGTRETIAEDTKMVTLIGKRSAERKKKLSHITQVYIRRFNQQAVLRVDTKIRRRLITQKATD